MGSVDQWIAREREGLVALWRRSEPTPLGGKRQIGAHKTRGSFIDRHAVQAAPAILKPSTGVGFRQFVTVRQPLGKFQAAILPVFLQFSLNPAQRGEMPADIVQQAGRRRLRATDPRRRTACSDLAPVGGQPTPGRADRTGGRPALGRDANGYSLRGRAVAKRVVGHGAARLGGRGNAAVIRQPAAPESMGKRAEPGLRPDRERPPDGPSRSTGRPTD